MKPELTDQKLRGGYYTPKPIADFLAKWAITTSDQDLLEPSCGDGVFLESAIIRYEELGLSKKDIAKKIHAVEFVKEEAEKASENIERLNVPIKSNQIQIGDFFSYCNDHLLNEDFLDDQKKIINKSHRKQRKFDVILGNPPFIRYQNFPSGPRELALKIMRKIGLHPNLLTNIWVPFIVTSTILLNEHGRLGMVIPAELFQVKYAAETRKFLCDNFNKITLISFKKLLFEDVQQEVILFLGEKNGDEKSGIRMIEIDSSQDLANYTPDDINHLEIKPNYHTDEKWIKYYLNRDELTFLESLKGNPKLTISGEVIDVDVGVVTGENNFFIFTKDRAKENKVVTNLEKIVTRSAHLKGIRFSDDDYNKNVDLGLPTSLLKLSKVTKSQLSLSLQKYIENGETLEVNKGFKCRVRNPWYVVPSVWIPDAFMLRQVHSYPKIILNETGATCTDTIHRVKFKNGQNGKIISAAFLNSLTFAFAEITGRSYGGGVLTFEPSEAEGIPIPLIKANKLNFSKIDKLLRSGNIEKILDINDKILLMDGLGLSAVEITKIRNIWMKLRDRRINRK